MAYAETPTAAPGDIGSYAPRDARAGAPCAGDACRVPYGRGSFAP
jgi:hypothetical protein